MMETILWKFNFNRMIVRFFKFVELDPSSKSPTVIDFFYIEEW